VLRHIIAHDAPPSGSLYCSLDSCLVLTNGPLPVPGSNTQPALSRSFLSDASCAGINGCISGDARIFDELGGDLRDVDGNLDRAAHTDIGALEFRPLELESTGERGTPTLLQRLIPNDPALIGQSFSFQALVDSPTSPIQKAFTNAVEVTVLP
jgi:hypothetical protein